MIHESAPWRDQIAKDADIIERWAAKPKWSEQRSIVIEKKVFLAAYIIRKLFQARKLTSSFDNKAIKCTAFTAFDKRRITSWNAYELDELYDLSSPSSQTMAVRSLLDLIIHSMVFCEVIRRNGTVGAFFVTSDRKRSNLWKVDLRRFISIMRHVAQDWPAVVHRTRVGETEEWTELRVARKRRR